MSQPDNNADDIEMLRAEKQRLLGEVARLRVSKLTSVPVSMLAQGSTVEEIEQLAAEALAWQAESQAQQHPATAAVPAYQVGQYSHQNLAHLGADGIMDAYRQGRLERIGGKPPPDQNGQR